MAAGSPANPLPTHLSSHPHVVSLVIFNSSWWNPRISVSGCGKIPKVSRFLWVKIRVWNRLPQSPTVYHQFTKENSHKLCYPPCFRQADHILSWLYIPLPYPPIPIKSGVFSWWIPPLIYWFIPEIPILPRAQMPASTVRYSNLCVTFSGAERWKWKWRGWEWPDWVANVVNLLPVWIW